MNKKKIKVFVTTNYFCNFDCGYCYLGLLKNDHKIIDADKLNENLKEISLYYQIEEVTICGGEITLLDINTMVKIIETIKLYTQNIILITNFSDPGIIKSLKKHKINFSVSLNEERDRYQETVLNLLMNEDKDISLIQVVTPSLIKKAPQIILNELQRYGLSVGFIQYSRSLLAKVNYDISNKEYSDFIKKIIIEYLNGGYNFELSNIIELDSCIKENYDPCMENIIYIDPYNKYNSIVFFKDQEHFKPFDSVKEWQQECLKEKILYQKKCERCRFYGHCYAEHVKFKDKDDECFGMKSLLTWYEENIYKNNRSL